MTPGGVSVTWAQGKPMSMKGSERRSQWSVPPWKLRGQRPAGAELTYVVNPQAQVMED